MDKSDENDHPIAFIPKAMINVHGTGRSSGSPCFLRPSHPKTGTVAGVSKSLN
ncbi:hypothetical protein AQPE_2458 [Aquipluma nitroreducens]|uniref:Uncharacterized protein n=1 Tax=Aquipluma nitroreducens TaxID=2010828 RepID=A0A5K7SA04_9BACT|nr:hypothetical protein AQPE_2458 [Aquipluma nitroreducens]